MKKAKTTSRWGSFFGTIPTVEDPDEDVAADSGEEGDGNIAADRQMSGISDRVVDVANSVDAGSQKDVKTGDGGKIKFKKAKKLTKKVGAEYSKALNNVNQSRFQVYRTGTARPLLNSCNL